MLEFPILWDDTSADSYSSMKDKYPKFYIISFFFSPILYFYDTKE